MSFLPKDYDVPKGPSNYMKLQQGDNVFRILDNPIIGWKGWVLEGGKRKPKRFRFDQKPTDPQQFEKGRIDHFWAMPVWNYKDGLVQVLEITQKTIMSKIRSMAEDADWGDPKGYDIRVTKEGQDLDTEYDTVPKPHKPLPVEAENAWAETKIDLNALYRGDDPFAADSRVATSMDESVYSETGEEPGINPEDIPF